MEKLPKKACLRTGHSEGESKLEALDNALIDAGIGDLNLVEVTSIIPENCQIVDSIQIESGTIVPAALAKISEASPQTRISASVSIAESVESHGVISEFGERETTEKEAKAKSEEMAERMLDKRGLRVDQIRSKSIEHIVEENGAVVAGVVFKP